MPKEDVQLVKDYCAKSPHLSYKMVTNYLNYTENSKVNYKQIYRIMKVLDLLQDKIVPKPKEYQLKQKYELTGPDQFWEMNMGQIYIDNSGQQIHIFVILMNLPEKL